MKTEHASRRFFMRKSFIYDVLDGIYVFGERERILKRTEIADEHGGGVFGGGACAVSVGIGIIGGIGNGISRSIVRGGITLRNRRFILEMSFKDGIKPVIVAA